MKKAIYKQGGAVKVWGMRLQMKIVDSSDIDSYLSGGWVDHPSKLKYEEPPKKRGRKPKAVTDESDD